MSASDLRDSEAFPSFGESHGLEGHEVSVKWANIPPSQQENSLGGKLLYVAPATARAGLCLAVDCGAAWTDSKHIEHKNVQSGFLQCLRHGMGARRSTARHA